MTLRPTAVHCSPNAAVMTSPAPRLRGACACSTRHQRAYSTGLSLALAAPLIVLLAFAFLYPVGKLIVGKPVRDG